MYKTIGILGGMGPAATCDLMQKIIDNTDAPDDQHHIRQLVEVDVNIPDRSAAILGDGEDPVPEMLRCALRLEAMGAEVVLMPCNTAHFFYDRIAPELSVPMLHMPRETAAYIRSRGIERVGVLGTDSTVRTGVYEKVLRQQGIEPVYPSPEEQKLVMRLIFECVKSGRDCHTIPVERIIEDLKKQGAEHYILGCTELPIAFARLGLYDDRVIDPSLVLARAAVRFAGAPLKG